MPLEIGQFRAAEEDVLSSPSGCFVLLDLNLHNVGRMLDHLGNVRPVTRANLTEDALPDPDDTSDKPVALQIWKETSDPIGSEPDGGHAPKRHRWNSKSSTGDDLA